MPQVVMKNIEYFMFIDNLDVFDDVGEAIDTLKKYGYIVENGQVKFIKILEKM